MTLVRRAADYRAAIVTVLMLLGVVGLAQVVRQPAPALPEPLGFTLTPTGDDVARLAPIRVTFPQRPDERDGAKLLRIAPATGGTYAWVGARSLLFQPEFPGLLRGGTYTVTVPARPDAGISETVSRTFTVTGKLAVQQVIPADGDTEVPLAAQVLVQFNRSVAPLTTLDAQSTEPPVRFEPALHGRGEWLNTSIYRFIPTDLAPSTTYRVVVPKGVSSAADGVLDAEYASAFTTVTPGVATFSPQDNTRFASPVQDVVIMFNQPMDRSAESAIGMVDEGGARVPGTVSWSESDTVATFTPASRLRPGGRYTVRVAPGVRGAKGGTSATAFSSSFTVAPPPSIARTQPADRETNAGRWGVTIEFATPMDPKTLENKISISGFTPEDLEGRVNVSEQYVSASVQLEPSTRYEVHLAAGATDRYGTPLAAAQLAFTTGALPSSIALALPGYSPTGTYSASAEPHLYYQSTNLASATFRLWRLDSKTGASVLSDPGRISSFQAAGDPLRTWTEELDTKKDETVLGVTSLSGGGPLPKGYYVVRTSGQYASVFAFAVLDTELVTKVSNDELLVWALDHDTGTPISGAAVHVNGPVIGSSELVTDANGLASTGVPTPYPGKNTDRSYYLTIDDGERFGVMSTRWQQGASAYQYGLPGEYFAREYVGQIYTDRPIYRPGETVDYKAIIRRDDDAHYTLPEADPSLDLVLRNARGQEIQRESIHLSAFGSYAGTFAVPSDAPLGDYSIMLEQRSGDAKGTWIAANSFLVAEFRKPEFQVAVTSAKPTYVDGESISVRADASYFFGGPVAGATVQYSAIASPYTMLVPGFESYSFTDQDPWQASVARNDVRGSGTTTTSEDGVATFVVPAVLSGAEGAQRYTLSTTVVDSNGQAVAASTSVTVHPAALAVGVHPDGYVASEGVPAVIDLVSVGSDGAIAGVRPVTVRIYDRVWITTKEELPGGGRRYRSEPKDTLLATLDTTTAADGRGSVRYTPSKPGVLRIVAEIRDEAGRAARAATYLWCAGKGFAFWQVTNDDTIKLVPDQKSYAVGDTARVLVPAPFTGAIGLVTVERGKVQTREVRSFASNSERLAIPILDRSVPDVFVSVVLYRPPTKEDPVPRYKVGYAQLPVSTSTRVLNVKITPDRAAAKPGDRVHYDIRVTDNAGRPVKAELSVAVVDKAILSLQEERGPDGLHAFWFERGLSITTSSSLAVSVDRWNDVVSEAARQGKGGAGGAGGLRPGDARSEFRNTAFWQGQLVTKDDGTASVDVVMPDDLTTWRMAVRAVSGDTMVGEGTNELTSTKPLLVRPALPRFVRVGDALRLAALVNNQTASASDVSVTIAADGIDVSDAGPRTVTVPAGGTATVGWPAVATGEGTVHVTFSATGSGGLSDTVSIALPASLDVTPETMSTCGVVTDESQIEAIYLPPYADQRHGSLRVAVRSALVTSMNDELRFFEPHEYENAEAVASRLIATLAVRRAETSSGAETTRYDARIASDVAGLIGRQRGDGGWAWCDSVCQSDPNVTGWVLLALGEARSDGTSLDRGVVERAAQYVALQLNRPTDVAHPASVDQKAFLVAALSAASPSSQARIQAQALYEQDRARLSNGGRAYLLLALHALAGGTASASPAPSDPTRALLNDLAAATIPSANGNHWEDPAEQRAPFLTNTSTTGLVSVALARVAPEHALFPQTIRWLVVARSGSEWKTNIDRALGMLGLSAYAVTTRELGASFRYRVTLDDEEILAGLAQPGAPATAERTIPLTDLTLGAMDQLAFERELGGPGRLYYTLDLRYVTPAHDIEALNRGFAISHAYSLLDDPTKSVTSAKLGDVVRVTMTIVASADRSYVTVEDMLPAGLEAIDARLANVDPALKAKLEDERRAAAGRREGAFFAPWYRWYYSPWQQVDLRDDRTVLRADALPKGVYEYVYYARATAAGRFFVAPAHADETYFPEVFGRSDSSHFTIEP